MSCLNSYDDARACKEHGHCFTCGQYLVDTRPLPTEFITCNDCELPITWVNDPLKGYDRYCWEFELRNYRGGGP